MTSFQDVVFTPSFGPRIIHLVAASWMVGTSLVMSVAAYYLLRRRHVDLAKTMMRVALPIFTVLAVLQVFVFGANQAIEVANEQPAKLAAMEGLYETDELRSDVHPRRTNPDTRRPPGCRSPACSASSPTRTPSTR